MAFKRKGRNVPIETMCRTFRSWSWGDEIYPLLATGAVMATFLQDAWPFRPCIGVAGGRDLDRLDLASLIGGSDSNIGIFGDDVIRLDCSVSSGSNENPQYSYLDRIQNDFKKISNVLICDRFVESAFSNDIANLFRTTRSSCPTIGEPVKNCICKDRPNFNYIPWVMSENLNHVLPRNRENFIILRLKSDTEQLRTVFPSEDSIVRYGQSLLSLTAEYADVALRISDGLSEVEVPGYANYSSRLLSAPIAILSVAMNLGIEDSHKFMAKAIISQGHLAT